MKNVTYSNNVILNCIYSIEHFNRQPASGNTTRYLVNILYKDNLCRLEDGTIAGSVLKLNQGVMNVYKNSNIPLWECVNCASLNPATAIGIADRKGSLDIGKDADIVITDENFEVKTTIIRGETKYEA